MKVMLVITVITQMKPLAKENFFKNSKRIQHLRKSNETYVNSNSWNESIMGLVNKLEESLDSQVQIDEAYSIFCDTLFSEIDSNLQINYCTKPCRKCYKYYKPYWSNDLTKVWKDMRDSEKEFLKVNKHTSKARKTELKQIYKTKRHIFDKALREAERNYKKGVSEDIETVNTENPKVFWNFIKKLGPRKTNKIVYKLLRKASLYKCLILYQWCPTSGHLSPTLFIFL